MKKNGKKPGRKAALLIALLVTAASGLLAVRAYWLWPLSGPPLWERETSYTSEVKLLQDRAAKPATPAKPVFEVGASESSGDRESRESRKGRDEDMARLREILTGDDLCALVRPRFTLTNADKTLVLMEAPDVIRADSAGDRLVNELFGETGALNGMSTAAPEDSDDTVVAFYNALLAGNMIAGFESRFIDYPKADAILQKLTARDPQNGAFPYFRAPVLEKLGSDDTEIKKTLLKSFNSPEFETFLLTITRRLKEKSLANPSYFLIGIVTLAELPIPNYTHSRKLIDTYSNKGDAEFDRAALGFGRRLKAKEIPDGGLYEFVQWNALEFKIGQYIEGQVWNSVYPGRKKPVYKSVLDLTPAVKPIVDESIEALYELDPSLIGRLTTGCRRERFDKFTAFDRELYRNFLKTHPEP